MPIDQSTHPVLNGGQFALISGATPKYRPEFEGGHQGLEQQIAQMGFKYEPSFNRKSPSFIVHGIPRDAAMELGRKAGQESVIYSNAGQHEMIYTNGPNAGKHHPGAGHESFHYVPAGADDGTLTHIPQTGFVRFNFNHNQLLDVPKKGENVMTDANKSEISIADFRKALAKSIQNQIDTFSKKLENLAKTEVANSDGTPSVGDLRLLKSDFQIQMPGLNKTAWGLHAAAAMKRVHDAYFAHLKTQFPQMTDVEAHGLAQQHASDWANNIKDPQAMYHMALGHGPEDYEATAHAQPLVPPDSMSPEMGADEHSDALSTESEFAPREPRENWGKSELDKSLKGKVAAVGAAAALAAGAVAGGTASTPSDKEIKAQTSKFTQDKENQPPANPREKYHKTEGEPEMCKTCKSEMCKCVGKKEKEPAKPVRGPVNPTGKNRRVDYSKRRHVDAEKDDAKRSEYAARGYPTAIKNTNWHEELSKSDAWMQTAIPPGFSGETMAKLEIKYGVELGKSIAWAAYMKKHHAESELAKSKGEEAARYRQHGRSTCPKCKGWEVYVDSTDSTASSCGDCGHKWDLTYPGSTKPAKKDTKKDTKKSELAKGYEEYADGDIGNSPHYKGFYDLAIKHGYPHDIAHREAMAWMRESEERQKTGWASSGYKNAFVGTNRIPHIEHADYSVADKYPAVRELEEGVNLAGRTDVIPATSGPWSVRPTYPVARPNFQVKAPPPRPRGSSGWPPAPTSEDVGAAQSGESDPNRRYPSKQHYKAEMLIDEKNAGTPPSTTEQARTGGPRLKNEGYENDKPAEPTKPIKGKVDEGSGGQVAKGKSLKKWIGGIGNIQTPEQAKALFDAQKAKEHAAAAPLSTDRLGFAAEQAEIPPQPTDRLGLAGETPQHAQESYKGLPTAKMGAPRAYGPMAIAKLARQAKQTAWAGQETYAPAKTQEVQSDAIVPPPMPGHTQKNFDPGTNNGVVGTMAASELGKAAMAPPIAKPPSGGTALAPSAPKTSKPGVGPKMPKTPKIGATPTAPKAPSTPNIKSELEKEDVVGAARFNQLKTQPIPKQDYTGKAKPVHHDPDLMNHRNVQYGHDATPGAKKP